jgi:hypothetical protein
MSVKLLFALAAQTVPSACTSRKLEAAKPLDLRVRPPSRFETNSREDSMAARSLRSIAIYFITPSLCSNLADLVSGRDHRARSGIRFVFVRCNPVFRSRPMPPAGLAVIAC